MPALVTAIPTKLANVIAIGITRSWIYCLTMTYCKLRLYQIVVAIRYHARSFVLRISLSFAVTYRGVCMGYKVLTVKSGILTPAVAKNPIALLKALSHAHESSLLPKVAFGARRDLFGGTLTNAHISRANHVGGTKIAFAKNSGRIFWGETNMKGN